MRLLKIASIAMLGMLLVGCVNEPTTKNPWNPDGPLITEDELVRIAVAEEERIKRQAEENAQEAADTLETNKSDYDLAVAELESEMQSRLRALTAQLNADARTAEAATRRAASLMKSELAQNKIKHDSGIAAIEREWARREGFASIIQSPGAASLAGLVPGLGSFWPMIATGIGGLVVGHGRKRRAVDNAYVEGQSDKEKEVEKRDSEWKESQAETIKMLLATGGGSLASLLIKPAAPAPTTAATP